MTLTAEQVATVLAFVVPGFVLLRVSALFSPPRALPFTEATLLSLIISLPLTALARFTLQAFPVAASAESLPLVAMGWGVAGGILLGVGMNVRRVRRIVNRLTTLSHSRIWIRVFEQHDGWIQVYLDSGEVFLGYAGFSSNDPSAIAPDLYLMEPQSVDAAGSHFPVADTRGLFIPAGRIRLIQFLSPASAAPPEATESS